MSHGFENFIVGTGSPAGSFNPVVHQNLKHTVAALGRSSAIPVDRIAPDQVHPGSFGVGADPIADRLPSLGNYHPIVGLGNASCSYRRLNADHGLAP